MWCWMIEARPQYSPLVCRPKSFRLPPVVTTFSVWYFSSWVDNIPPCIKFHSALACSFFTHHSCASSPESVACLRLSHQLVTPNLFLSLSLSPPLCVPLSLPLVLLCFSLTPHPPCHTLSPCLFSNTLPSSPLHPSPAPHVIWLSFEL